MFPPKESNRKLRGIERLKLNMLSITVVAPGSYDCICLSRKKYAEYTVHKLGIKRVKYILCDLRIQPL
jgi:hypothetical protein